MRTQSEEEGVDCNNQQKPNRFINSQLNTFKTEPIPKRSHNKYGDVRSGGSEDSDKSFSHILYPSQETLFSIITSSSIILY